MGMQPDGRELLVVCLKGTFTIPRNGGEPQLAEEQVPLIEADESTGEPGYSAPLYESEYPPIKPRCDVLLNGSAYAPEGKPVKKVPVSLHVGSVSKSFNVVGDRVWEKGLHITPSEPMSFTVMPISYDRAFGGIDDSHKDPNELKVFLENPIGVGFHYHLDHDHVNGTPLPNSEELDKPIKKPDANYQPMSFGPVGRGWQTRSSLAGTYDQTWMDNVFPFLPADFDKAYYQSAPLDQQMDYPKGDETMILVNLTPEGRTSFRLPNKNILVWFFMKDGSEKDVPAVADTIMIEPDEGYFTVTWRASLPLKKNMFEVELALIVESEEDREKLLPREEISFPLTGEESVENGEEEIPEEE